MRNKYIKARRIRLQTDSRFDEKWVQGLISDDPSILGLGELELRDFERNQPSGGRVDLLLRNPETLRTYEVELQLGATDAAHIIRTIEYWDIERKRYPQYEHCAVLVAEDITSRFFNVISLFNGSIPIIAIQMSAIQVGDSVTVVFTTILDELRRGQEDEPSIPADREYWEKNATKSTTALTDTLLEKKIRAFDSRYSLKYNRYYIGLELDGRPDNFIQFVPQKKFLILYLRLPGDPEIFDRIESSGLYIYPYNDRHGHHRIRLSAEDVKNRIDDIGTFCDEAWYYRTGKGVI